MILEVNQATLPCVILHRVCLMCLTPAFRCHYDLTHVLNIFLFSVSSFKSFIEEGETVIIWLRTLGAGKIYFDNTVQPFKDNSCIFSPGTL
jgi:hypothetical protein